MLEIKHKIKLTLPHASFLAQRPMHLSPVPADSDELSQDINRDSETLDNNWQLDERPDMSTLEKYWTDVETDLKSDPQWVNFSDE